MSSAGSTADDELLEEESDRSTPTSDLYEDVSENRSRPIVFLKSETIDPISEGIDDYLDPVTEALTAQTSLPSLYEVTSSSEELVDFPATVSEQLSAPPVPLLFKPGSVPYSFDRSMTASQFMKLYDSNSKRSHLIRSAKEAESLGAYADAYYLFKEAVDLDLNFVTKLEQSDFLGALGSYVSVSLLPRWKTAVEGTLDEEKVVEEIARCQEHCVAACAKWTKTTYEDRHLLDLYNAKAFMLDVNWQVERRPHKRAELHQRTLRAYNEGISICNRMPLFSPYRLEHWIEVSGFLERMGQAKKAEETLKRELSNVLPVLSQVETLTDDEIMRLDQHVATIRTKLATMERRKKPRKFKGCLGCFRM